MSYDNSPSLFVSLYLCKNIYNKEIPMQGKYQLPLEDRAFCSSSISLISSDVDCLS